MIIPLYLAFDKYAIQILPVLLFCAMIHLGSTALLWQIEYNKDSRPSWTCIKNNGLISISVIIHALGYTLILFAMKSLSLLTTLIASQTSLICATLLGILFLKDKINIRQIIAIISIIFGITIYSINNIY